MKKQNKKKHIDVWKLVVVEFTCDGLYDNKELLYIVVLF